MRLVAILDIQEVNSGAPLPVVDQVIVEDAGVRVITPGDRLFRLMEAKTVLSIQDVLLIGEEI